MVQTLEGKATPMGNAFHFVYDLKDQLGNTRVSFDKDPTTQLARPIQVDDYYAFGLHVTKFDSSNGNKYLYNGKELQEELGQYDYGPRFYDPVIGRWNLVDPLAESYQPFSSYNYVLNNPLSNTDPDGRSVNTRFVNSLGQTIINTDDGRNDVVEVADKRIKKFKKNIASFSHNPDALNSVGWNNYWKGEAGFTQTISGAVLDKAGFNSLSSENVKSAAIEYMYGSRSFQSVVWQEIKAQWSNPMNVAMAFTAFAHGMTSVLQPKPSFGYPEIGNNTRHATRYLSEAGLNVEKVKAAITRDLKPASSYKVNARIQGAVTVDGVTINYSGTKLENGKINIGSIKPPR